MPLSLASSIISERGGVAARFEQPVKTNRVRKTMDTAFSLVAKIFLLFIMTVKVSFLR